MSDFRRSLLWLVFGFSIIMLWDRWQVSQGNEPLLFSAPPASEAKNKSSNGEVPSSSLANQPAVVGDNAVVAAPKLTHTVKTDVLELVFDAEGGNLIGATLLQHPEQTGLKPEAFKPMVLMQTGANHSYSAQTGLIGAGLPNHKTPMKWANPVSSMADGQDTLTVRFETEPTGGVVLAKTYEIKRGSYLINVSQEVRNVSQQAVQAQAYVQLVRDAGQVGNETPFYQTFTGPAVYTEEKKFQKVAFEDITKKKAEFVSQTSDGYIAMVQHYFTTAWILPQGTSRENFARELGNGLFSVGSIVPLNELAPGQTQKQAAQLFVGPQEERLLEAVYPGLELVKDYGWVTILAKPLYWLLEQIHKLVGNWGWAIILLVVLIKAAFYWLNASAYRSMAKMKAVNPRIQEMRERMKDNPQQMQVEMMRIYREEKINPLGGCFPILIQIPVFIALYWVLLSSVEMRNAPWVGWITDLSTKDPYYILPVIMTITTIFQTALNPLPPDPLQAKLMWTMPLVFSVMFFFFPAGLVLYWITNNVLTVAQQWHINHRMGVKLKLNIPVFKRQ